MFFKVKVYNQTSVHHVEFLPQGEVRLTQCLDAEAFERECWSPDNHDLFETEMVLQLPESDVELIERIYVLSPASYLASSAWPATVYLGRKTDHPLDDGCPFVTGLLALKKAIHRGINPWKLKARVSLNIDEPTFDELFDHLSFKDASRGKYQGELLFSPPKESASSQESLFLAGFVGKISKAREALQLYQQDESSVGILLQKGEEGKIRRRMKKHQAPYPTPAIYLQYQRRRYIPHSVYEASLANEDVQELQAKLGTFEKKNREGLIQYKVKGPAKVVYNPALSKVTFTFAINKVF